MVDFGPFSAKKNGETWRLYGKLCLMEFARTGDSKQFEEFGGEDAIKRVRQDLKEMNEAFTDGAFDRVFEAIFDYDQQPPDAANDADVSDVAECFFDVLFFVEIACECRDRNNPAIGLIFNCVWPWAASVLLPVLREAADEIGIDADPLILMWVNPTLANCPGAEVVARKVFQATAADLLVSREEADVKVAEIIQAEGWPGSLQSMANKVGCSHELVRGCPSAQPYIVRKHPRPKLDTTGEDVESVTDPAGDPLEAMVLREDLEDLDKMLKALPAGQRQEVEGATPQRQRELVEAWKSQKRDAKLDSREKYELRRQEL